MSIATAVHNAIALNEYAPNEITNSVMTQLVNSVIDTEEASYKNSVDNNDVIKVREVSALTETELEVAWARKIISAQNAAVMAQSFPYLDNYRELTRREVELITHTGLIPASHHKALVVGSGPLPLSAIELHKQTGMEIYQVDSSEEAVALSAGVCDSLGLLSRQYCASGQKVMLVGTYDVVLIAALAGATIQDKQAIVDNILPHLSAQGRIILRSARGNRELLYPAIKADEIKGVTKLAEYHPNDHIINSVFVYGRQS